MKVHSLNVDRRYRTQMVDGLARRFPGRVRAVMGVSELDRKANHHWTVAIDRNPATGTVIAGGLRAWCLDVNFYKDWLANLQTEPPHKWHVPSDIDHDYLSQITAWHKVLKRAAGKVRAIWTTKPGQPQDHLGDCEVYALAAAEIDHLHELRVSEAPKPPTQEDLIRKQFERAKGPEWEIGAERL